VRGQRCRPAGDSRWAASAEGEAIRLRAWSEGLDLEPALGAPASWACRWTTGSE
jgi:hypothetical protein